MTVYRKPTHMDQYLQLDSHHHLSAKFSVIHTLTYRVQTVCSNPELLHREKTHLRKALIQYKYPKWALDKVERRLNKPSREVSTHKVSANASRRSVGGMAYRSTSKVVIPSGTYWYSPRTKTLWLANVGPYIGSNVMTFPVMMNM